MNQLVQGRDEVFVLLALKAFEVLIHDAGQDVWNDTNQVFAFFTQLDLALSFILRSSHSNDQPFEFKPFNGSGQCAWVKLQGFGQIQKPRGTRTV